MPRAELERLDGELVGLAQGTAALRLAVGETLVALTDHGGLRRLGFASLEAYARERCERSGRWARDGRALARRLGQLPLLRAGLRSGQLGWSMVELLARHASPEAEEELLTVARSKTARQMREHFRRAAEAGGSGLVGRIATARTAAAWLARAAERTIKHLSEEVATAEVIARTRGHGDQPPPDDETQSAMMALESHVLSGRIFRGGGLRDEGQMSGDGALVGALGGPGLGQMSGGLQADVAVCGIDATLVGIDGAARGTRARRGAGKVTQRFRVARDVARAWHALAKVHARSGLGGSFVELLCVAVWQSWQHTLGSEVAYADLHARERYRCSSPVCFSRNQTPHHVRFRSHGGDDHPENLTAPCVDCHLEGIHGGNIRASGAAPALRWEVGRAPVVEVQGRVRLSARSNREPGAEA